MRIYCKFLCSRAKQAMLANEERKRRLMKKKLEEAGSTSGGEGKKVPQAENQEGTQTGSGQVRQY